MNESAIKSGKITPSMSFNEKVWALTARVPKGKVVTYAQIARKPIERHFVGRQWQRHGGKSFSDMEWERPDGQHPPTGSRRRADAITYRRGRGRARSCAARRTRDSCP